MGIGIAAGALSLTLGAYRRSGFRRFTLRQVRGRPRTRKMCCKSCAAGERLHYSGIKLRVLVLEEFVFFEFGANLANLGKDAFDIEAEDLFSLAQLGSERLFELAHFGAEGFLGIRDSAVAVNQGGERKDDRQDYCEDLGVGHWRKRLPAVSGSHISDRLAGLPLVALVAGGRRCDERRKPPYNIL